MINTICSNPFGFSAILVGVPAIMGIVINVAYNKYAAWDKADKASRQRKLAIIRNRR